MRHPKIDPPTLRLPKNLPPPSTEKRRHPRVALQLRCWIGDERHTLYVRLHDLSRGGLSVRVPVPFQPATAIEVDLELPGGRRVKARGEVVWVRNDSAPSEGPRMGARFVEFLDGEDGLDQVLGNA